MISSKATVICILKILKHYSDEAHILNANDIKSRLKSIYDIEIERKAVYRNIEVLIDLGYDISTFEENKKGYYLRERDFEESEIRLLADAVYSSKFIPVKASKDLIKKLKNTQSDYNAKKIKDLTIIKPNLKTLNTEIFYNIETIDLAIQERKQIDFVYCRYDFKKVLIPRREEKYVVNPYSIVWANEHYYLVCNYDKYDKISYYRIDYIKNIGILDTPLKPFPPKTNLNEYVEKSIYMFGGKTEQIEILCNNCILDDVIDKFGKDVRITIIDDLSFKVSFAATPAGIEFWALQYINYCEVLRPLSLRETIIESIETGLKKYERT